jgi:hypothetical protein
VKNIRNMFCLLGVILLTGCSTPVAQSESSAVVLSTAGSGSIPDLVRQLAHRDYGVRQSADRKLRQLPPSAVDTLQYLLTTSDDPEVIVRLRQIMERITPPLDARTLRSIVIPEIDFRQASLRDCLQFIEEASVPAGSSTNGTARRRVKIIAKFNENAGDATLITFSALDITVHEALDIIVDISGLKYRIHGGAVIIERKRH